MSANAPLIGIVGGGQLGRMIALAGYPLGLRFRFLDPSPDCPASQVAPCVIGDYDDPAALALFAPGLDLVTYEFENVPVATLDALESAATIYPPRRALAVSQDRLQEKRCFTRLGIETPRFAPVASSAELDGAVRDIGLPAVLKTRRFGYDGKGQEVLNHAEDVAPAWERLNAYPCILEEKIAFDYEVSIIAARSVQGEIAFYDLAVNQHEGGILRVSRCTERAGGALLSRIAKSAIETILTDLEYVGVLALELFVVGHNRLLANEMAPRVHNTGHWTIEGTPCSQFENHLRAILGLPLGHTAGMWDAGMVNLIGRIPEVDPLLAMPNTHVHLYGKEPRPGRKVGHITTLAPDAPSLEAHIQQILAAIGEGKSAG